MLKQEIVTVDGRELQNTYSDAYKIRQIETGTLYTGAVDVIPCPYTYEETDIPLPVDQDVSHQPHRLIFEYAPSVSE